MFGFFLPQLMKDFVTLPEDMVKVRRERREVKTACVRFVVLVLE